MELSNTSDENTYLVPFNPLIERDSDIFYITIQMHMNHF